jgi:hypothetical protein
MELPDDDLDALKDALSRQCSTIIEAKCQDLPESLPP